MQQIYGRIPMPKCGLPNSKMLFFKNTSTCSAKVLFGTLHKKWSFSLRISSASMTKQAFSCGFGHIYRRNPWWRTSIFVQWDLFVILSFWKPKEKEARSSPFDVSENGSTTSTVERTALVNSYLDFLTAQKNDVFHDKFRQ